VQVCSSGVCDEPRVYGARDIAQVDSIGLPSGERTIKVWLADEAGHADPGNAVSLTVDPTTVEAPNVVETLPPVLDDGPAAAPRFKFTRASRNGAILTLSGTIVRTATARISANVSKGRTTIVLASGRTSPNKGKWSLRLRLSADLRHAKTFYVTVSYAGQKTFAKSTLRRRLSKKPARQGSTAEEFSLESRSAQ
jgi:hypothetical protein